MYSNLPKIGTNDKILFREIKENGIHSMLLHPTKLKCMGSTYPYL